MIKIPSDTERGIPPESERKFVRRFRGRMATVTLSRCGEAFYVTPETITTVPKTTLRLLPTTKAEALEGARFISWLFEEVGQYAAVEAAGRNIFSKS